MLSLFYFIEKTVNIDNKEENLKTDLNSGQYKE